MTHDNKTEYMEFLCKLRLKYAFGLAVLLMGLVIFGVLIFSLIKEKLVVTAMAATLEGVFVTIGWTRILKYLFD
jgi:hypothetical protein